ncbi:MAG: MFS transporter [Dehalococcoidia bacterium]|nr:MFS transporter [Dehalococcoidia bacterium]MYK25553.1 MFS transporter [Dehalococcoidia bacterium]
MSRSGVHVVEAHYDSSWDRLTSSLRYDQFRWLYISNMAFMFAMMAMFLVRSVLAYDLTNNNAFALGIVNLVVGLPMVVVSPLGGAIADRIDRRRLVLLVQTAVLVDEALVFFLLMTDQLTFPYLLVLTCFLGVLFPFMMPARQAIVANVVGRGGLGNAMALQMGGMNVTRITGPVAAGALIPLVGMSSTYGVALVLYGVGLAAMLRVRPSFPDDMEDRGSVFGDIVDGFRYVWEHPPVRVLLAFGLVPTLLAMPFQVLLVVFAIDVWHEGEFGLGLLNAAAGVGGLLGAIWVAWGGESHKRLRLMMASIYAFGATLVLFCYSPIIWIALPLILLADVFVTIFMVLNNTAIQILIPDYVRGRVMSLLMMSFGLTPFAALPISWLAEEFEAPIVLALSTGLMMILAMLFFLFSPALRRIDTSTREAEIEFGELDRRGRRSPDLTPAAK